MALHRFTRVCIGSLILRSASAADPSTYNEEEAKVYAQAARAAFCDGPRVKTWSCGEMCDAVPLNKNAVRYIDPGAEFKVAAYVGQFAADHSQCIVAFRGSADIMNWVADFKAWPVKFDRSYCPGCWVHTGFDQAYEEIRGEVDKAIEDLKCKTFVVVGHSLGGAVATLAAFDLRAGPRKAHVPKVYLLGTPRTANQAFVDAFDKVANSDGVSPSAWRIIHYHDPVPRLCPRFFPFDFSFMPREVYYNEQETQYKVCDATNGEDPTCADSVMLPRCIDLDHVTYLNLTFRTKYFPQACISKGHSPEEMIV